MVIEETTVPNTALPVPALRAHLRLGTGFGEETLQDAVLEGFLRAALAAIEARTGKALIRRDFVISQDEWRDPGGERLPVAPVQEVTELALLDAAGAVTVVAPDQYRLRRDTHAPRLCPQGGWLPNPPAGGSLRIRLSAGMAETWDDLPADLGQAVLLLAAHYYEYRDETALGDGCMPFGVTSLIQRYRGLRIGFAGGAR